MTLSVANDGNDDVELWPLVPRVRVGFQKYFLFGFFFCLDVVLPTHT
jgi:hypothetical protein